MSKSKDAPVAGRSSATDADRYPTVAEAVRAALDALPKGDLRVDRVELTCQANGDVNCRWWEPRSDEAEIVHIPEVGSQ